MPKFKLLALISLILLIAGVALFISRIPKTKPILETNNSKIEITASLPPKSWSKYETADFTIYYPAGRIERHIMIGEDHDGFALCPDEACLISEVSVYPTDFSNVANWLTKYEEINLNNNYKEKYLVIIYPNLTINGNKGAGSFIEKASLYDPSVVKLDTAVIQHGDKTYGITYNSDSELDKQILSTLKFKN